MNRHNIAGSEALDGPHLSPPDLSPGFGALSGVRPRQRRRWMTVPRLFATFCTAGLLMSGADVLIGRPLFLTIFCVAVGALWIWDRATR